MSERRPGSATLGVPNHRLEGNGCSPESAVFTIHHKLGRIFTYSKGKFLARLGQKIHEWPGWISKSITLEYFYSENIFVPHIIQTNNTIYLDRFFTRRVWEGRNGLDI
jgi:hypothetical protein